MPPLGIAAVIDKRFKAPLGFQALDEGLVLWFSNANVSCNHKRPRLTYESAKDILEKLALARGIWTDDQNQAGTAQTADVRKANLFKRLEVGEALHLNPIFLVTGTL